MFKSPRNHQERMRAALWARAAARSRRFEYSPPPGADRAGAACPEATRLLPKASRFRPYPEGAVEVRLRRLRLRLRTYFYKMRGHNPETRGFSARETLWSFGGAFLGMFVLVLLNVEVLGRQEQGLLLGSFGASAMLVFGAPHAPFAQPRNVIGGHVLSALAGVFVQQHFGADPWIAASLAVALSVAAMHLTATLHPPGGATALLAVVGSPELKLFGYGYALHPVGLSMALMVLAGLLYNNLSPTRRYPLYWW